MVEAHEFARFFQLTALGRNGKVRGGSLRVKGIADLGTGLRANPGYTYREDHDNQFDIIIKAPNPRAI